ncbi:hypothetical protein, partial [Modestobacter sp. KNN46-3]|uniref:hypothetical protein n=1 Tax=Modestobacter sp. KNN46-3 TaxID=2711218 RepID=UPI0013DF9B48
MPIAATPVADEAPSPPGLHAAAVSLLPTRATLLDRITEQTAASDVAPAALVLVGLLRRDTGWPLPGDQ